MHSLFKLSVFLLIMAPLTDSALAAYWVDDMNQPSSSFSLSNKFHKRIDDQVTLFKILEQGDCIETTKHGAKLSIANDSGVKQTLSYDDSNQPQKRICIDINDVGIISTNKSNLISWAGRWLGNRISSPTARSVVSAVARGDEPKGIVIPLANQGGLKMVAGKRPVYLAWQGGKQPFSVRMVSEGDQRIVFELQNITDRRVKIDSLSLAEGTYRIEIGDAVEMIAQNLHIVSAAEIPSPTLEPRVSKSSQDRVALVEAVRLASQGEGWAFEAYQTASELSPQYQPAQILRESLENGDMPKPMPE